MIIRIAAFMAAIVVAAGAAAQAPHEPWHTITTPHFRVHYPLRLEAWSMRAASRLESVREAVVNVVGYAPKQVTDVVVMNPIADPNGITLPLLDSPRIVLYAEPPQPEIEIGEYSDWIDLLTVHETAHLVHLLRPPRNPMQRLLTHLLPLNPITLRAPRWVLEGYATVVEGRITGSGRPSGSLRAAVLRKWAQTGQLPSYAEVSSDRRFFGGSMAYLMGSAFLEWLEQRSGPDSLQHLWARMTARRSRTFDGAFAGVFGDSPQRLYGVFVAEVTENARAIERGEKLREGELWLETSRNSGDPAVSPDGKQLAIVVRDDKGEAKLAVVSTGPNEAEEKLGKEIAEMLRRDPEDVAPVRSKPLPRKPLHTLTPPDGGNIENPRWTRDGSAIVYTHRQPDRDGFLHRDLFRWTPGVDDNATAPAQRRPVVADASSAFGREAGEAPATTGTTHERRTPRPPSRITHLADVGDADPIDDKTAVAVRSRDGYSQLVKVDLNSGAVSPMTEPALDRVFSHPRVSRDGRIAWAEHTREGWHISMDGKPLPTGGAYSPEWTTNGELLATVAGGGFIEIAKLTSDGATPITRSSGAAVDAAPSPDGSLFFMSLDPDGFIVRHLADVAPALSRRFDDERSLVPALPPKPAAPIALRNDAVTPRDHGIGRQELATLFGGQHTPHGSSNELGIRLGDVVGRLDTIALLATGGGSLPRGGAIASTWRGWPIATTLHLFKADDLRGAELRGEWSAVFPLSRLTFEGGALAARGGALHDTRAFARGAFSARQRRIASESLSMAVDSDRHACATLRTWLELGGIRVGGSLTEARRMSVGGTTSSIEPDALLVARILDPALDRNALSADRYRGERIEVASGLLTMFFQRHHAQTNIDVAGVETSLAIEPMPLLKSAAMELLAGVARVRPEDRTRAWIALRWRP
jgi:Tol biopolymer transport system component